jgi:hypothetical protein
MRWFPHPRPAKAACLLAVLLMVGCSSSSSPTSPTPSPGAPPGQNQTPTALGLTCPANQSATATSSTGVAVSFAQPHPEQETHWWQVIGTKGQVEWRRAFNDKPKMWLANSSTRDKTDMDWTMERPNEPPEARETKDDLQQRSRVPVVVQQDTTDRALSALRQRVGRDPEDLPARQVTEQHLVA